MKKILLFAAALCLMISAQAQIKTNESIVNQLQSKIRTVEQLNRGTSSYTQKLDSVVVTYGALSITVTLEYDEYFNTTKVVMSGLGNTTITEHTYDSQNHRIRTVNTHADGGIDKTEYTYNNQGLLKEETQYEFESGEWEEDEKSIYEYDANDNLTLVTTFDYDDSDWVFDAKTEYTYQNGKLDNELTFDWIVDEWIEDQSIDYFYDDQGYLIETTEFDYVDIDWVKDTHTEYAYDANRNCTSQITYDYDDDLGDWEIDGTITITYDLTVPSSIIAGLDNFSNSITNVNNKILTIEETSYSDGMPQLSMPYTFYYSGTAGMGEHDGSRLAIWPNPTTESLNLNSEGLQQVEIFTIDGRQVMHLENGFETINVSALAKGCYLLTATFADGSKSVEKFVKE